MPPKDAQARKEYNAAYYATRKAELVKRSQLYRAEHKEELEAKRLAYREMNKDRLAAYSAEYQMTNSHKLSARKAVYRKTHPEQYRAYDARKYALNPEKVKAQRAVSAAIRAGRMVRAKTLICSCGQPACEYHHVRGYAPEHALDVVALCKRCHAFENKKRIQHSTQRQTEVAGVS